MNFLAPLAFWFALLLPVIVLFYLLKRRRVLHVVPSTLLWERFLAENQANAPFQKLRRNWLLVLQLLLLILVILALARPYFVGEVRSGGLHVLIMDASASMQSEDVSPSRFEQARSKALEWIQGMKDETQIVVLEAAGQTQVKQSPTSEKTAVVRALKSISVTDGPTEMKEALKLAKTLVKDRANAEVHLFSDGSFGNLEDLDLEGLPLVYHQVGERGQNIGLVSLDVRSDPKNPSRRALFAKVVNHTPEPIETEVELYFKDQLLEVQTMSLAPTNSSSTMFQIAQPEDGYFQVRLPYEDDLAADNQARIVSYLPKTVRVLLLSEGNRYLERALSQAGNVELSIASDFTPGQGDYDIVVVDGVTPSVWPDANLLSFRAAAPEWFGQVAGMKAPPIVEWDQSHPLLRFVGFDNVQVTEAARVKTPPWAQSIVESTQSPILLAGERGRQRIVWVAFDPLQSSWPLRISFPIFVANAVDWLNPAEVRQSKLMVRAGEPLRYPLMTSATSAEITHPDGETDRLKIAPDKNEIVFGGTDRQGIYELTVGTNRTEFAVNAMNPAESDTAPKDGLTIGEYGRVEASEVREANIEIWRWVAVAGLLILLAEWWYYHRRTV